MTISIKPTASGSTIEQDGSTILTVDGSGNLTVPNNLTSTGGITGNVAFDTDTLYVDATNNRVGIGTSSPNTNLEISTGATTNNPSIYLSNTGGYAGKLYAQGDLVLGTGSGGTERLRVLSANGNVLVNTSSAVGSGKFVAANNSNFCATMNSVGNGADYIQFWNGSQVGSITRVGGTNVAYNTSSDYRLKENVAPMSGSIDRLKQLKPSTWSWKIDGSHGEGFLAHEAQTVVPESATGTKDAMRTEEYEVTPEVLDDDGNVVTEAVMGTREVPDYQGIDQSKLVPLLTAALQEAITKIENLETRIEALEAN